MVVVVCLVRLDDADKFNLTGETIQFRLGSMDGELQSERE